MTEAVSQRAPHVLVVAPTPFFSDRGCHVRILEEIHALRARGYRVTVCTYHVGKDVEGLPTHRSLHVPWYDKLDAGPSPHKYYLDLLLAWTTLRVALRDRPDVIHAHLHEGIVVGKPASLLLRVPMVADLQGSLVGELLQHRFFAEDGLLRRAFVRIERLLVRLPHRLVLSSPQALDGVVDLHKSPRPITLLPDGVDLEAFRPAEDKAALRERLGLPRDRKLIAFLGVLNEYQGVGVMLRAAKRVVEQDPRAHLLVMGYPNVDRYQREAAELGIADHTTFTGRMPYEQACQHLAACDIGFSAKQDVTEANGKLLNYMAVGLPVVATDTRVNRALLGDTALYGGVDDAESLASALLELLSQPDRAAELGAAARRRAEEQFSWQAGGRILDDLYRQIMRRPVAQPAPQSGAAVGAVVK